MYKLNTVLRPYAWGSTTAIAELLGREPSGGPEAELWIGAHPGAPSRVSIAGREESLDQLISEQPEQALGAASRQAFGDRLPFLMKVLAAQKALSLQVHPTLAQAAAGFKAEDDAGVPREADHRNYKDDNHKPEMIFALTPFEALCGFRAAAESLAIFRQLEQRAQAANTEFPVLLREVCAALESSESSAALRRAFELLITGGEQAKSALLSVVALLDSEPSTEPFQQAFATVVELNSQFPGDIGALISLLLNRVHLEPGESLAMPAGNVHAYLHGLGIEVMASSDNVLRGGLTPKFVDVPELLRTIDFRELPVPTVTATETELGQELYLPGFSEFQLQRIVIEAAAEPTALAQNGAALILVTAGTAVLDSPQGDLSLVRGESAFIPAVEAPVMVHSSTGCTAFAVTTNLGA
ncbi:mannose-6-phosphate isomerase, class I [Psychromicrobium sp. YIM B11713]|uniref:mannose-6-phosphate isomerase, class I n=1 Tax=Psychromicrobium sp. YIM B11713 TaxID=3145233 RepID=UPI00374F2CFF